jgi:hypothetical protein
MTIDTFERSGEQQKNGLIRNNNIGRIIVQSNIHQHCKATHTSKSKGGLDTYSRRIASRSDIRIEPIKPTRNKKVAMIIIGCLKDHFDTNFSKIVATFAKRTLSCDPIDPSVKTIAASSLTPRRITTLAIDSCDP